MDCDKYLELFSARLDGALAETEERELEAHLAACPDCRAAGAQLAALQGAFPELEDIEAPEGFARGVMDRIREETSPKVLPLFKRPQFRALAGLAACAALVVGLYGAGQSKWKAADEDMMLRNFSKDAVVEFSDVSACESLTTDEDVPRIAAYAAPEPTQAGVSIGTEGMEKAAPSPGTDGTAEYEIVPQADAVLILDYLPDGAAELIPSETAVSHDIETGTDIYTWLTAEELAAIEALAFEQGLIPGTTEAAPAPERCALIVRNK